jgi:hypothetical protein
VSGGSSDLFDHNRDAHRRSVNWEVRMSRSGKLSPLPIIFPAGQVRRGKPQRSEMMATAEARFVAEREDFVRTVADHSVKERLAAQIGVRHALQRKALVAWSKEVERRLTLRKISLDAHAKPRFAPRIQEPPRLEE